MSLATQKLLRERISAMLKEVDSLTDSIFQTRRRLAEELTEVRVGDTITYEKAKFTWLVTLITTSYGDTGVRYFGNKLKKDGTPRMGGGEIWQLPFDGKVIIVSRAPKRVRRTRRG